MLSPMKPKKEADKVYGKLNHENLPDTVDWRDHNAVNAVKD